MSAIAITYPTDFRQPNTAVVLIQFAVLRKAETVLVTLAFEFGKVGTLGKEVFECTFQVFQTLMSYLVDIVRFDTPKRD